MSKDYSKAKREFKASFASTDTIITSNKNIHFEMILDVGIGEKRKETRFLI